MIPFYNNTSIYFKGFPLTSLQVVYKATNNCQYGKCTHCAFKYEELYNDDYGSIADQHDYVLENFNFEHLEILTPGSFFSEISLYESFYISNTLAKLPSLKRVLVESRVDYLVNDITIQNFAKPLLDAGKIVEIAFGYDSSNDGVRNLILNKNVAESCLSYFLEICKKNNLHAVVYIVIKPPFLTEEESVVDAVKSSLHVLNLAEKIGVPCRVNLEPIFVAGKYLEYLYSINKYFPPSYFSICDVIGRITREIGYPKGRLYIGLSNENLSIKEQDSCPEWKKKFIDFNTRQNLGIFVNRV